MLQKQRKQFFTRSKRRPTDDNGDERGPKNPRIEITKINSNDDNSAMIIDSDTNIIPSLSPSPSPVNYNDSMDNQPYSQEMSIYQDDNEVSSELKRMSLDNSKEDKDNKFELKINFGTVVKEACCIAQTFEEFTPLIKLFLGLGKEIVTLYEKAEHHKELCSFLLQRCNCATAAVQDLYIRKTENTKFFCKQGNLDLFKEFIKCIKRIKCFIEEISQLSKIRRFLYANNIEETFYKLITEFDGYMNSLNFNFTVQAIDEFKIIKNEAREIKELLFKVYKVSDDSQSQQKFLYDMESLTERNKDYQKKSKQNKSLNQSEFKILEENEPLLDGSQYQKTKICPSKRIEKRTTITPLNNCNEFCFKEFSNNITTSPLDESQIEVRRQVNILKELKNFDHIIRFFGVAQENSKYYLVTEWMEHGNLYEYYTNYKDDMNWGTKIKFALDICCGISYLNDCQILHHDIQSANILVDRSNNAKIANFGLSKKFYDLTRNISPNIENVRYMAPEKLLSEENDLKRERVPYDSKCEVYSVGALLWEIAELKKPHYDLNKSEILVGIRKRVIDRYSLPLSDGMPDKWKILVKRAMLHEPACRPKISEICRKIHKLKEHFESSTLDDCFEDYDLSIGDNQNTMPSFTTVTILTVNDAIRVHKSKNGNKQLALQSFKYHSSTDIEAKYWLGYYYYHHEPVPEIQKISKEERIKLAVEIFKETADKGNPSAQLRYGICLWQGEGVESDSFEALRYLKMAADSGNSAAMYVIGKAYWNGGNGIERDEDKGAQYLRDAASKNHLKAKEMCTANNINFQT